MRTSALRVIALLMLPGLASAASFTPLGPDYADDVSADGSVVVGVAASEAWRWTGGVTTPLNDDPSYYIQARTASGVSADGAVVVGSATVASWASGPTPYRQAFRWTGGQITALGILPGHASPDAHSEARAVSADGAVVVGFSTSGYGVEAFRWAGGAMTGLGFLPGGVWSWAYGVSADGSIVVGIGDSSTSVNGPEAFRWVDGVMTGLGYLPGKSLSNAYDTSADGSVVVGDSGDGLTGAEAYRWVGGVMTGLGDLPGGDFRSTATSVSADGSVVVGNSSGGDVDEAFIWTETKGMERLFDVLVENGATGLTGWHLNNVRISGDGKWVVGWGINPAGETQAFLANISPVPVPPAVYLFGSALGLMGVMRRKIASL